MAKIKSRFTDQSVDWNDQVSTGIIRVGMFSPFAYRFWRDFFIGRAQGATDWWDAVFAIITTIFIFTSAGWALRKWLERRRAAGLGV